MEKVKGKNKNAADNFDGKATSTSTSISENLKHSAHLSTPNNINHCAWLQYHTRKFEIAVKVLLFWENNYIKKNNNINKLQHRLHVVPFFQWSQIGFHISN